MQKPKDPKKVAAELEETKKLLMGQMGIKPIEELKTDGGEVWLVFRTVEEICTEFYKTKLVAEGSNVN